MNLRAPQLKLKSPNGTQSTDPKSAGASNPYRLINTKNYKDANQSQNSGTIYQPYSSKGPNSNQRS